MLCLHETLVTQNLVTGEWTGPTAESARSSTGACGVAASLYQDRESGNSVSAELGFPNVKAQNA
jgi:hypothetical protein